MLRTDKIRNRMELMHISQRELAEKMCVTTSNLCLKLKRGIFKADELEVIAEVLKLQNPWEFFFGKD